MKSPFDKTQSRSPYKTSLGEAIHEFDIIKFWIENTEHIDVVIKLDASMGSAQAQWYAMCFSVFVDQLVFVGGRNLKDSLERSSIVGKLSKESHHPLLPKFERYGHMIKEIKRIGEIKTLN